MPTVIVNGQSVELGEHERLNGIEVARRIGVDVPHYCWHPGLSVVASCRMCLLETGRMDKETGEVTMMPKLVPGCQTPATDGTVFVTDSEKVEQARAMVEEDLLIRHPIDCPICDKAGECLLQDYHFKHGQGQRRADLKPFTSRRRPMGETVTLFVDRCVMCSRCVRFTREITGTHELMVVNRGAHEEIDVFPGFPLANKMSGNVVDLCPVGALGDRDFLYSQRVWFMEQHPSVCAGCATGCSITVDENQDRVYRLKPRENPHINAWWMCDEGRYGFDYIHDTARQREPQRMGEEGDYENVEWSALPQQLDENLRRIASDGGRLAAVISPFLTVEEAFLMASYFKEIDPDSLLAVGPIPIEGEEESFPNGFTIRAEKCPNRKGVEAIVSRFGGGLTSFDALLPRLAADGVQSLWISGGYPSPEWITAEQAASLADVPWVIVQDLFASPAWDVAQLRLPSVAFAERAGSYVNFADRLQSFDWAIRPPAGAMSEGQLFWRLLKRPGMYQPAALLPQIGRDIAYFSAAIGEIPSIGVDLKVNQLAGV